MGINNIHILINDDNDEALRAQQVQVMRAEYLTEAHRRGEHPWGSKRRNCPLCQRDK